jgi:hypothetical protein
MDTRFIIVFAVGGACGLLLGHGTRAYQDTNNAGNGHDGSRSSCRQAGVARMTPGTASILIGVYLGSATFVFAGVNAAKQWDCHHELAHFCDDAMVRGHRIVAAALALAPPSWAAALLLTRGFHYGFDLESTPASASVVSAKARGETAVPKRRRQPNRSSTPLTEE